jgi:hypothetical protein
LHGFSDADHASQEDRHSISGFAFMIGGCVTASSKRQPIIALSSTEAEYIAMTHSAKEAIWLRALIGDLHKPFTSPTPLHCDNQSAIALSKENQFHARTKRNDLRYHFIRETIEDGHISVPYCPTEEMTADIFYKGTGQTQAGIFQAEVRASLSLRGSAGIYQACEARPVNSDMIEEFTELVDGFNFPISLPRLVTWLEFTEL